jgi:hypothetical protein
MPARRQHRLRAFTLEAKLLLLSFALVGGPQIGSEWYAVEKASAAVVPAGREFKCLRQIAAAQLG